MRVEKHREIVANVPLFGVLSETEIDKVCDAMEPVVFKKGEAVVTQGDDGVSFYVVL